MTTLQKLDAAQQELKLLQNKVEVQDRIINAIMTPKQIIRFLLDETSLDEATKQRAIDAVGTHDQQ